MRAKAEPFLKNQPTMASNVYERLRTDVVQSRFAPGEKLRVLALTKTYEVGASPVREALNRLAAEGLVVQIDHGGFRVPLVSVDDMMELTRTRCLMNELALRESIALGGPEWEQGIILALHYLSRAPIHVEDGKRATSAEWERRHREFHYAVIAACGSRWILNFCKMLFDLADRYRFLWATVDVSPRDILAEHRAIAESVLARDADAAVELMNSHLRLTADAIAHAQNHRATSKRPKGNKALASLGSAE